MSVSYYSEKIVNDRTGINNVDETVEFNRFTNYDCKSVDVSSFEKSKDDKRIVITFRNYKNQKEINYILKAFSVIFDTKFIDEENFDFDA